MKPLAIAHRGYHDKQYFENTKEAFIEASKMDYFGIETDVHRTKDGVWIIHHNDDILSGGKLYKIVDYSYNELKNLRLDNTQGHIDAKICLFDDYLTICKNSGKRPIIEIKNHPKWKFLKELISHIIDVIGISNFTVIAFYPQVMFAIKMHYGNKIHFQFLVEKHVEFIPVARLFHFDIDIADYKLTDQMINKFHKKGLKVNVWTVDDKKTLRNLESRNVDYITTNKFTQLD